VEGLHCEHDNMVPTCSVYSQPTPSTLVRNSAVVRPLWRL